MLSSIQDCRDIDRASFCWFCERWPASHSEVGTRLLINVVDSYALHDPSKVWASVPVDDDNLAHGFRDITYKEFANAVNHARWWMKENFTPARPFETIAYAGPDDLQNPILALAAAKCYKRVCLTGL